MQYGHLQQVNINTKTGKEIKVVENFKYMGSWMQSTGKDMEQSRLPILP